MKGGQSTAIRAYCRYSTTLKQQHNNMHDGGTGIDITVHQKQ